jgi:phage shock protein A
VDAKDDGARQGAFKKYSDQLKEMDKQIQDTKDYAKQMKERGQAYFAEWEKSMQTISNETLKAKAAERRATLQAQYQQIQAGVDQARQDSTKFWKDLQDLQK